MANRSEKAAADSEFKKLYKQYYTIIYKFCLSRLKDDTEAIDDIVQETFIVLYNKLLEGSRIEFPHAFLYKTADNLIKRYYVEKQKSGNVISLDDVINIPTQNIDLDERLAFEQYAKEFSAALNDTDAELFSMRYIEELEITEIAEKTGMSVSNTATRLYRLREKIRKIYGEKYY